MDMSAALSHYLPPAPKPRSPVAALIRAAFAGERDLLSLLPDIAYRELVTPLGMSRRTILLVNDPQAVADILVNADGWFPKNDLMVGAWKGSWGIRSSYRTARPGAASAG